MDIILSIFHPLNLIRKGNAINEELSSSETRMNVDVTDNYFSYNQEPFNLRCYQAA